MAIKCNNLSLLLEQKNDEDFNSYMNKLYYQYEKYIANGSFMFRGKPVSVFTDLNYNLQHQTFEHITTKGSNNRLYNIPRCQRILWIRDILNGICSGCVEYRVFCDTGWKSKRQFKRYIVWCLKEDYVIVLEERTKEVKIITAYCILYKNKRVELENAYQKSKNASNKC